MVGPKQKGSLLTARHIRISSRLCLRECTAVGTMSNKVIFLSPSIPFGKRGNIPLQLRIRDVHDILPQDVLCDRAVVGRSPFRGGCASRTTRETGFSTSRIRCTEVRKNESRVLHSHVVRLRSQFSLMASERFRWIVKNEASSLHKLQSKQVYQTCAICSIA